MENSLSKIIGDHLQATETKIQEIRARRVGYDKLLKHLLYSKSLEPEYEDLKRAVELVGLSREMEMAKYLFECVLHYKPIEFTDISEKDIHKIVEEIGV